jgi:hypothetical protein
MVYRNIQSLTLKHSGCGVAVPFFMVRAPGMDMIFATKCFWGAFCNYEPLSDFADLFGDDQ